MATNNRLDTLRHTVKLAIEARSVIMPGEDAEALAALTESYYQDCAPCGPMEAFLVDTMIECDWNRRRLQRLEASLVAEMTRDLVDPPDDPLGFLYKQNAAAAKMLEKIARRQQAVHRNWHKAEEKLALLRESRALEQPPLPEAESPVFEIAPISPIPAFAVTAPSGAGTPAFPVGTHGDANLYGSPNPFLAT